MIDALLAPGFLLALILGPVAPDALGDDELLEEFARHYRGYADVPTRVEAILALDTLEEAGVVAALAPLLKAPEGEVVEAAVRVLGGFETRPPVDALGAALAAEKDDAIELGLLRAVERGAYGGLGEAVTKRLADRDWELRRAAALALAAGGAEGGAERLLPLCKDREAAVRGAAFDGLARFGGEAARQAAAAGLADRSWQVRAAAIGVLAKVRHRENIPLLIERLRVEEGRLRGDAAAALEALTGRSFGLYLDQWQRFWETNGERYELPSEEQLAALRARRAESRARYEAGTLSYHGIDTPSRSIVFVVDVSGSMEHHVVERERFEGKGYPSMARMEIVKTELLRTIEALEPWVKFNVYAFGTGVRPWKKKLVAANVLNKSSALSFVERLEPIGGSSQQDLARAGLIDATVLAGGQTNTHAALMVGLGLDPDSAERASDYESDLDTLFFLSDGRPTTGRFVDPDDILADVERANALRRVVIHTIAIGEFQKDFMEELARRSGGSFVDLGR